MNERSFKTKSIQGISCRQSGQIPSKAPALDSSGNLTGAAGRSQAHGSAGPSQQAAGGDQQSVGQANVINRQAPVRQASIPTANTLLSTVNAARQRQPMCGECEKSLPNQIVFDRIESIIRQMQDEQNGLPVKTAKSFMSKIPSVFTGTDLIQWMMRNLKLEDQQEAMHLANLIASHGYIFPIEDHTLSIKHDCTFYRFQTPCLWPSNNSEPENTDYAVYLCKRTMQGKTRLELADYEAENLARLQKMFSRKWEFIFMQAESQAKVDKKRDKLERKVLDSQERAFWDVYRPVPGCVNTTELDIKKACRLSKSAKRCSECQKVAAAQSGGSGNQLTPSPEVSLAREATGATGKTVQIVENKEQHQPAEQKVSLKEAKPSIETETEDDGEMKSDKKLNDTSEEAPEASAEDSQKETEAEQQAKAVSSQQPVGHRGIGGHQHHRQNHHHHHHHHHPHQHGHHHHHHRQCPLHKHQQESQQSIREQQLSIPTESILTTAMAASAGLANANEHLADDSERSMRTNKIECPKKCSAGSAEQFIRAPSVGGLNCRRKSECNRMLSMIEQPTKAREADTRLIAAEHPLAANTRPASACCSYSNHDRGGQKEASTTNTANQQQPMMTRKSSLNILRPNQESKQLSATSLTGVRKSSINMGSQHSPLTSTHSVCIAGSSKSELSAACGQNLGELERELEALKVRLDRRIGGVKMSKVTQSYLSYFKQWAEYDPFIAQPIPSNPWISDSTELWDSERQTKDVHCRRVRRWAFSLKELLSDPAGREQFHRFLEKEFSAENLKFWDAVQELKRVHSRDVARRVEAIWTEYLAQDANCPINIDSKSYETSKKNMAKNKNNRYIFDEAAGHVYQLMKNDSYPRYLRSDMYKDYKEASEKKRTNQVAFDVFKPQITTLKHKFNF